MKDNNNNRDTRRSMILGIGTAMAGAALVTPLAANAQSRGQGRGFQAPSHDIDTWMDELSGNHRIFIDTSTGTGGAEALLYAANLNNATTTAYAGEDASLAIIVCYRHFSTPFAFNDGMWEKYGEIFHTVTGIADPNTSAAPRINLMQTASYGLNLPSFGNTIDSARQSGVEIAICDAATQFLSSQIGPATGQEIQDVYEELKANAVPGRFVSAGVMALTRAQEYGYSLLYAG
ncbi:MAG: hypothetical protein HOF74_15095 [Gammaproteobacteria bacterium]|jgi:hypothetical protein|nr:hypothetical protein [Gammaproteobacteria bacterium]MBT3861155.1 hypothetical protein [Gammaproteobacteria bacterium]MBT3988804.1 hypothetical protein [Gammaproteobacteria bacterium]MBT4256734.1 hypothetical protein [Gammaproteobacteria bacterium]MBT4582247.1 hypothetical protein [Gammaproteobacteria bacterium]